MSFGVATVVCSVCMVAAWWLLGDNEVHRPRATGVLLLLMIAAFVAAWMRHS